MGDHTVLLLAHAGQPAWLQLAAVPLLHRRRRRHSHRRTSTPLVLAPPTSSLPAPPRPPCCPWQGDLAKSKRERQAALDRKQQQHFAHEKGKLGRLAAIQLVPGTTGKVHV